MVEGVPDVQVRHFFSIAQHLVLLEFIQLSLGRFKVSQQVHKARVVRIEDPENLIETMLHRVGRREGVIIEYRRDGGRLAVHRLQWLLLTLVTRLNDNGLNDNG